MFWLRNKKIKFSLRTLNKSPERDKTLNSLHAGYFFTLLMSSAEFFLKLNSKNLFRNTIRVSNSLVQIKTGILLLLISVKTVCKGYQQMIKVATSKERFKCDLVRNLEGSFFVMRQIL